MRQYPSVRKAAITAEPTSVPFINYPESVCIQDDHFFPYFDQEQPRLQSPFQYHQDYQFVSPPSSAPSSPTSSPASSISHFPATTPVAAEYYDSSFEAPSMTPASSYNPSFHIQPSASPSAEQSFLPQYHPQQPFVFGSSPMLAQHSVPNNHGWESNLQLLSPAHLPNNLSRSSHLQTSSSSSGRSSGSSFHRSIHGSSALAKPLPTPVQTPVQNSFLAPQYQQYDDGSQSGRIAQEQNPQQPGDYSLAPSVSSVSHSSPVTPQNNLEDLDEATKAIVHGENRFPVVDPWMDDYLHLASLPEYNYANGNNLPLGVPKLSRTISDVYQDELYNPNMMQTPQAPKQPAHQQNLLTPSYRNVFADRLQAASQGHLSARSQSPAGAMQRDHSPFRQNSPLAAEFDHSTIQQQPPATSVPSQAGMGLRQPQTEPKTMSPKDAVLEFNEGEDAGLQLFPSDRSDFNLGDALGQTPSFQPAQSFPSMESFRTHFPQASASQAFTFHQSQQDRQQLQQHQNHPLLQQPPEFPASLPPFESTGSEVLPSTEMTSPPSQSKIHPEITRPQNTSADTGTYTCTYHGCTLRFGTPAKLQKHKREAHRQTTPRGHLVGRDGSSRNSQAGPHKCERINPSTGKPCNSIFSRPYDLTRHEDTIHNARKQKVRCHLCTEEKTFSRNDALTRHMRVVHPEIDWPGKQRRRGRD
ncbi:hypothetical protein AOCH_007781 [Aspergillus ochraceoroseus]|uniref:C2H2-type domain-containing protein n=1 Tax=Aspergillus ochraceoroseus TaxID=138278 RepID=A0A0F8WH35_9EURO|nr:hypothetical protein AOCH_007781 [Aspergillus ochraceoroseus]